MRILENPHRTIPMLTLTRILSWRYLRKHTLRMALATLSIALGVATLVGSQVLNHSTHEAVRSTSAAITGAADLQIVNGESWVAHDAAVLEQVRRMPGVAVAAAIIERKRVTFAYAGPDGEPVQQRARLLGFDPADEAAFRRYDGRMSFEINEDLKRDPEFAAAWLRGRPLLVAVSSSLHRELPPTTRKLTIFNPAGSHEAWIAGVVNLGGDAAAISDRLIFMELSSAMQLFGSGGKVTRYEVRLAADADPAAVKAGLQDLFAGRARVQTPELGDRSLEKTLGGVQVGMTMAATAALFVGMFLVYNTLAVTVAERRHEIGVLRALGATRGQVRWLFAVEALVLGGIGSALGVAGGVGLARLSLGTVRDVLQQQFAAIELQTLLVSPLVLVLSFLAGLGAALAASLAPAASAAAEPPSDALRRAPVQPRLIRSFGPLAAAVAAVLAGVLLYAGRHDLPPRIGSYGCLYLFGLAFMLATPITARLGVRLIHPLTRVLGLGGRLAADDLHRSPARTGLTVGALALSLALTIDIAGIIRSTETPIFQWLSRAVSADLFVTSGSPITGGEEHTPLAPAFAEQLRSHPDVGPHVRGIIPVRLVNNRFGENTVKICALPIAEYTSFTTLDITSGAADAYRLLLDADSNAVLVSDNFSLQYGLKVGETFTLADPAGKTWRIVGTLTDYTWNEGTIFLDRSQYLHHFRDDLVDSFDLYLTPGSDAAAVREAIGRHFGPQYNLVILTNADFQQYIRKVLMQFYGLLYANAAMALAVSFMGVANTLAISVLQRRRELGLLRAVGATRAQVAWSVAAQALLIAILGVLLGTGLGVILQEYTLGVLMVEEAGQFFPFLFPWQMTAWTGLLALAAAQASAALPALRAASVPVSEAIAYE